MKKYLLIAAFAGLIACDSKKTDEKKEEAKVQVPVVAPIPVATKPNEVGRMVFAMFKTLDNQHNLASLQSKLLTMEELREIAEKDEETRKRLLNESKESFDAFQKQMFLTFKKTASEHQIDWANIEYVDYVQQNQAKETGINSYRSLSFTNKGKKYYCSIGSIFNGREYKIIEIGEISIYNMM